jgi:transposase-like protein
MAEWQTRPLDSVYPVIFIDAIRESRSATAR